MLKPNANSLYDLSKLTGEALCIAHRNANVRVVRLSNVYGPGQSAHNFLGSVLQALRTNGTAAIQEAPNSSKDYVALADVVPLLERIAISGTQRLYHGASGTPITHAMLGQKLETLGNYRLTFRNDAPLRIFPRIDIGHIRSEFGFTPRSLLDDLPQLLHIETAS